MLSILPPPPPSVQSPVDDAIETETTESKKTEDLNMDDIQEGKGSNCSSDENDAEVFVCVWSWWGF